jgi:hypothetical protein
MTHEAAGHAAGVVDMVLEQDAQVSDRSEQITTEPIRLEVMTLVPQLRSQSPVKWMNECRAQRSASEVCAGYLLVRSHATSP